ncbi:hypothetical protein HELRODRAFT_194686 [Helobdella robusta]|uniref:Integrin alpha second immunoglobulin-like domain-containing protein n=1 Tax=Helobdella robusta TaxID=6412 RepID=T1FWB5_HELRO|nr:hypothetical protein HELRODRAFT_194686 [Helobdella robusta]ESN90050.1 hypothetical protein HELRODRAFT_194686 [Helobdella robusta]
MTYNCHAGVVLGTETQKLNELVRSPKTSVEVCGHLHKRLIASHSGHGRCIKLSNSLEFESQTIPCQSIIPGTEYAFCQAGTSADFSPEGSFLMGAPGSKNWRGTFFKRFISKVITNEEDVFNISIETDHFAPFTKPDGSNITNMYSYLGMSVRSGYVGSDPSKIMHISGAPRSKEVGQVDIYNSDEQMIHQHTIHGEQFGSYFGHEIVIMDINSDGKDDMIVGAPFYRKQGICGAIYVYMNEKGITNKVTPQKITSRKMMDTECEKLNCLDARFGFSMASAGDLDGDGFNDLVVGAPYEGQGAIYIFHGRRSDLSPEPAQRIYAGDLKTPFKALAFGSSLAGSGFDVDGNGYPDILVGSYASDTAFLFFSRPVANVKFRFENLPKFVDPMKKEENCKGNACFTMRVCFILSPAKNPSNTMSKLLLSYSVETDTEPRVRSQFYIEKRLNINFSGQDNIRDYLRPLTYQLTFQAFEKSGPTIDYQPGGTIPNYNDYPVIVGVKASHILLVHFRKNCGDDEVCSSNLKLQASLNLTRSADSSNYVLRVGQDRELEVKLAVENKLEDAHQANLYITVPANFGFIGTSGKDTVCSKLEEQNVVECSVGNPLPPNERVEFGVRLDPRMALPSKEVIDLKVMVNTTSNEMDSKDNEVTLKLEVIVETDLGIRGFKKEQNKGKKLDENNKSTSFRICVEKNDLNKIRDPNIWPSGVILRDWIFNQQTVRAGQRVTSKYQQ